MFHATKKRVPLSFRTSSSEKHYPFQVEITSGLPLRCYIGRVVEKASLEENGEQTQKAFPVLANKITHAGLQRARPFNRSELQHKSFSVRTGSAKIFQKTGSGRATFANAVAISEDKGYAEWQRSTMVERNYVILHREVDDPDAEVPVAKWCLSSVGAGGIESGDIVVALVTGWKSVNQIWKSDVYHVEPQKTPEEPEPPVEPPVVVDPTGETATVKVFMVNNLIPVIRDALGAGVLITENNTIELSYSNGYSYVYLKVGCDQTTTPHQYPVAQLANGILYPQVISSGTQLESTDDFGYILLAAIKQTNQTVYSFVSSSLWSDRIKVANAPATYYFSRV
jgi:hypothetical protein